MNENNFRLGLKIVVLPPMRMLNLLLLISLSAFGQENLVPNPSFEEFETCPDNISHKLKMMDEVIPHWYTPTLGTPDYYNGCAESVKARTGDNWIGELVPEKGDGCIGLLIEDDVREYIQVKLTKPLKSGVEYTVRLTLGHASKTNFASNGIGVVLTQLPIAIDEYENIYIKPYFRISESFPGVNGDVWETHEGTFIASGGEQYLTLGNTNSDSESKRLKDHHGHSYCYYFFDEVEVIAKTSNAKAIEGLNNRFYEPCFDNLVMNGNFEMQEECEEHAPFETYLTQNRVMPFWHQLGVGSPDNFNYCSGYKPSSKLDQRLFNNKPLRGDGMMGFIAYQPRHEYLSNYTQYIAGFLKTPMVKDHLYTVSFRVKLADVSAFAIQNIGLRFFDKLIAKEDHKPLDLESHIPFKLDEAINAKHGWYNIKGTYKAQGGETCFAIGLFGDPHKEAYKSVSNGSFVIKERSSSLVEEYAYYLLDEVAITKDSSCSTPRLADVNQKNIVIMLDASSSMSEDAILTQVSSSIEELSKHLNPTDHIHLLAYSNKAKVLIEDAVIKDLKKIKSALSQIHPKSTSNISVGLHAGVELLLDYEMVNTTDHLILITNGKGKLDNWKQYLEELKSSKARFDIVGINLNNDAKQKLNTMISDSSGKLQTVDGGGYCLEELLRICAID